MIREASMEIACDAALKNRQYDADGRLHILRTPISKATVNPYYGREIPDAESLGLEPDRIYYLLRDPGELAKAATTFARIPLMFKHIAVNADDPKQESIAGTIGSDVEFIAPYLIADLCVWDAEAIAGIESDEVRELSSSYRYRADMTPGIYEGQRYDGVMRDIQANHVATVSAGRAGSDVRAADSRLETKMAETKFGKTVYAILSAVAPKLANDAQIKARILAADESEEERERHEKEGGHKANEERDREEREARDRKRAKDAEEEEREREARDRRAKDRKRAKDMSFEEWAEEEEDEPEHQDKEARDKRRAARDAEEYDEDREKRKEYEKKAEDAAREARDSFDGLVEKLMKKGYSKEYATKIAGKVAKEKGDDKAKDSKRAKDAEEDEKERERKAEDKMHHAMDEFKRELREAEDARRAVRPVVGDVLAYDSAADIYSFALDQMKVDHKGVYGVTALRALFNTAQNAEKPARMAFDAVNVEEKFAGASRPIRMM